MNRKIKNLLITVAIPLGVYLIMELIVYVFKGGHVFNSILDIKNLVRSIGIACTIAYALSFNLGSGRFDLSLGAQRLVATTVGCLIALQLGFTGVWLLVMSIVFGVIVGTLTGVIFVLTRVPPMVLGIGMALVYETVAFAASDSKGLDLYGIEGISILADINFTIIVIVIAGAMVMGLMEYTKFGYQMRAIQGSQTIAQSSGINIFRHALLSYTFAGGLVAISGVFSAAFESGMAPTMGFASNGAIVINTFPMFLGTYMSRWSNKAVGILFATITLKIFAFGLSALKMTSEMLSVIDMSAFLLFLIFLANQNYFKIKRAERARVAQAHEFKKTLQAV